MFEHATAFLLQRHWKSHIHWLLYLYSFNIRTLFLLWFMTLLHTRNARCWFQLWFVVLFQIMFFIYSLCQGWKQTHEPTSQTSDLHLAPRIHSQEAFKVEFFKWFTGTKWPQLTETARVYPYPCFNDFCEHIITLSVISRRPRFASTCG